MKTYRLVAGALLAGLSLALQLSNAVIGVPTGWGMTVDLVAVPILLALFVFGYETALEVLLVVCLGIVLVAPTGAVGALMKFGATLPMLAVPAFYAAAKEKWRSRGVLAVLALLLAFLVFVFGALSYLAVFSSGAFGNGILAGLIPILGFAAFSYALLWLWKRMGGMDVVAGFSAAEAVLVLAAAVVVRGLLMIAANFYFAGPLFFKVSSEQLAAIIAAVPVPFLGASAWYASVFLWNAVQAVVEFGIAYAIAFNSGFAKKYGGA